MPFIGDDSETSSNGKWSDFYFWSHFDNGHELKFPNFDNECLAY